MDACARPLLNHNYLSTDIKDGVHHHIGGHDRRATLQTAISNVEINARQPLP